MQGSSTKPWSANWSRDATNADKDHDTTHCRGKDGKGEDHPRAQATTRFSEREHRSVAKLERHRPLVIELTSVVSIVLSMFPLYDPVLG